MAPADKNNNTNFKILTIKNLLIFKIHPVAYQFTFALVVHL